MRRYDEPVDVHAQEAPISFVWRGRLYVVRAVLDRWFERSAWWRYVLDGAERSEDQGILAEEALQDEVFRVEASPGRAFGVGVYDLVRVVRAHPPGASPYDSSLPSSWTWRLLRTAD